MACEEARQLLDALMGGDRNGPLPPGAAVPRSKKKRKDKGGEMLLLPGKRSKSCLDTDIDPLYCAWGVDVFELFVNTKSDIGPNPYVTDEGAHKEFMSLPPIEQERLGFNYFLFQKLQELVRSGDRTVQRNKEKLAQELRRLAAKRGANQPVVDYVQDVDEQAVESLATNQLEFDFLHNQLETVLLPELDKMQHQGDSLKEELGVLFEAQREKDEQNQKGEEDKKKEEEPTEVKAIEEEASDTVNVEGINENKQVNTATQTDSTQNPRIQSLQIDLGKLTLQKQHVLWETAKTLSQIVPLQESLEGQLRALLYVKSDIAADKTVCEVSGNFMSARDADERIAAHYAGKQYVGWRLVREKLQDMIKKHGRYGPPPPDRSRGADPLMGRGPPPTRGNSGCGYGRGGGGFGDRGGGYGDRGGAGRGRGRYDGGGAGSWGGDRGGRWERHGPGGPGGGGYSDRRGVNRGGGWRR